MPLDCPTMASIHGSNFSLAMGQVVSITTNLGKQIQGVVCCHEKDLHILALEISEVGSSKDYIILNTDTICHLHASKPNPSYVPNHFPVNESQIATRQDLAIEARSLQAANQGIGVSPISQLLFDTLKKTLPCRWEDKSIVVMDCVTIIPPYTSNDCSSDNIKALAHVRKVVEGERKKLNMENVSPRSSLI